ncbi:MAG: hypothetical protein CL931_05260 [Deltaproteobacteria bacterium]|nr:hypothetical protein [Deltaproteobacteria bacterium]
MTTLSQDDALNFTDVLPLLDEYRAQEALGAQFFGAWVDVCDDAHLRGGLRTIALREASHVRLLTDRIKVLGGAVEAELADTGMIEQFGSREMSDAEKLAGFMQTIGSIDAVIGRLGEIAAMLDGDPDARGVLDTIIEDEQASLNFLSDACQRLNAGA